MILNLNPSWLTLMKNELEKPYFQQLMQKLSDEYKTEIVYPSQDHILEAFNWVKPEQVKVVILGQDPYHNPGEAHGLSFSVPYGVKIPPSLRNIYKEIESEFGGESPNSGDLTFWAKQGVLLLNSTLTVRQNEPQSHQKLGWSFFTDSVIQNLSENYSAVVFMLWGSSAQKKEELIHQNEHLILKSAHPSPLSAYRGFFGNNHFILANEFLKSKGKEEINWI